MEACGRLHDGETKGTAGGSLAATAGRNRKVGSAGQLGWEERVYGKAAGAGKVVS